MKTTFVATVFNEEETIHELLDSISEQTKPPDEVIIVDGGSNDKTVDLLKKYQTLQKKLRLRIVIKNGNRSVGRNGGIQQARNDIILISDAGCILDKHWVEEITKPFSDRQVDAVAGYYRGRAKTVFQKCLIPYVLVMEDRVDPKSFLPATRSMAFRKEAWEKAGGFNEQYSHNEDYVFARTLRRSGAHIVFTKNAIVYWLPRQNLKQAFSMFYRFAKGDTEAGIWRKKVILQFLRYLIAFTALTIYLFTKSLFFFALIIFGTVMYSSWAIVKNYRYVRDIRAFLILPLLQFTADIAVLMGSTVGIIRKK